MAAVKLSRSRVFCLEESVWTESVGLSDRTSVLPTLELLHRLGSVEEYVHRHVVGATEFENYLDWRASGRRTRRYGTIYLAFHGTQAGLDVGGAPISLDTLAEGLGPIPGAAVHLGSCSVLRGQDEAAQRFLRATGARVLSGYERDVDWIDSAALDTAWLGYLAGYQRVGDAERALRRRYASLIDHLKWTAVSKAKPVASK